MLNLVKTTMNSFSPPSGLGPRLEKIKSFHRNETCIWDIGCDHGDLGLSFRDHPEVSEIHLVDSSLKVINSLTKKIKDSYITKPSIHIHNMEGEKLNINQKNAIVFVAGMGGRSILDILVHLSKNALPDIKFVVSPHRNILELRNYLAHSTFICLGEDFVQENNKYYQVICFAFGKGKKVHPFGSPEIWKNHPEYLLQQVDNFSRHRDPVSLDYVSYLKTLRY